ncbi:MAG: alkaline phosphatase family protein [Candidatus Bathyarchaeota archaeon]|nr:alkaline phosphatase family protein [Candidatus Bathyarchaeota archaeon]
MSKTSGSSGGEIAKCRVLVLGLDGATFRIIEPMVGRGRLPNLARLMSEGACGVLESTLPPVTIPAWPSMMTGKNPGKLGYFDFLRREGYGVEPNGYCFEGHAPLWQILNRYGVKTGVMNLPGTYPPDEVDGFMVSGMLTPSKRSPYSYPATLGADLDVKVQEYEIDVPQWQYFDEGVFVKDLYKVTEKRARAAEYLIKEIPCEFYMIVFTSCDRLQHVMWDQPEVVEAYWEWLDRIVGRVLRLFGEETTVFVVSDHGFGPLERTFFVNEWLRKKKLLRVRRKINEKALVKVGRLFERLYRFLGERELVRPIVGLLNRLVGFDMLQRYTYAYLSSERLEGRVNWRKTKAFSCVHTPHFGQIYVNMRGKMRRGRVSRTERQKLQDAIIKELKSLPDSDGGGGPRVEAYRAEDIYSGPHVEEAPDIVFLLDGGRCEVDAKVGEGRIFAKGAPFTGWKGTHTMNGVFIARGPGIKPGHRLEKATILDVAPTVLRVFGIPPQREMDGRALEEIFSEEAVFPEKEAAEAPERDKKEGAGLSEEEKALIEARLRRLGYIS